MNIIPSFRPNGLTFWASRNIPIAITAIVLIEITKFWLGFHIGKNAFPAFSSNSLSIVAILIGTSVFVAQNYFKPEAATKTRQAAFSTFAKGNFLIFTASFLLSVLVGNQWSRIENPAVMAEVSAKLVEESSTKINADSLISVIEAEQLAKEIKAQQTKEKKNDGMQRLGYFALFLLSLVLTYLAVAVACGIACSGYGIIAVLVLLLGLGILGGGVYFLLKVFRNGQIKKWREMDKSERKRERKRYFLSLLIAIGSLAVILIAGSLL